MLWRLFLCVLLLARKQIHTLTMPTPNHPTTLGMLETTRIRREGYSSRPLFADFVRQYEVLAWGIASVQPNAGTCRLILERAKIDGFQMGKTKV